jgi:hypothetical protein
MPAPGRCQSPGITERVDSRGLVTFGVEGETRLLHKSPIGAAAADGPSKPSLHHNGGSPRYLNHAPSLCAAAWLLSGVYVSLARSGTDPVNGPGNDKTPDLPA